MKNTQRTTIVIKQVSEHMIGALAYYENKDGRVVRHDMERVRRYDQAEVDKFIRRHQIYAVNNLFTFHIADGIQYSLLYGDPSMVAPASLAP